MINQPNFSGDISFLRGSCISIEKDYDRKIQQTKNILRQTTLSLQKLSDTKLEYFQQSQAHQNAFNTPLRRISITSHKEFNQESESKTSDGYNSSKMSYETINNQNISQNQSNFNIGGTEQTGYCSNMPSLQNSAQRNDMVSSKCSIKNNIKLEQCSKEFDSPFIDTEEIQLDGTNELEKRIHQWLDGEDVKMVNPCKKYQDYYENKRSKILIMHKKKHFNSNANITSYQINIREPIQSYVQNSEKIISMSHNASPQKLYSVQTKASLHRNLHEDSKGSEIIINHLFSTAIADSPLMQRRKMMLQVAQEREINSSEKKVNNCSVMQLNPANSGMNNSLVHLSQYKRSSGSKSNNEIPSDISSDCK